MALDLFLLLSALAVIAKSSSIVVDSAVKLSQITGVSRTVIGFIFIGVATSLPELSIGIISSLENQGTLSVGNLLGANVMNLTLILGLMSFVGFNIGKIYSQQLKRAIAITVGIAIMIISAGSAGFLFGAFLVSVYYLFSAAIMRGGFAVAQVNALEALRAAVKLIVSVAIVVMSAYVATNSAVSLAGALGISNAIIGAAIISIGTTMPELSVNVAAILKRNIPLAIGDMTGTITTNLALVLGIVTMINPVIISPDIALLSALLVMAGLAAYLLAGRMAFGIKEALFLTAIYFVYISVLLVGAVI